MKLNDIMRKIETISHLKDKLIKIIELLILINNTKYQYIKDGISIVMRKFLHEIETKIYNMYDLVKHMHKRYVVHPIKSISLNDWDQGNFSKTDLLKISNIENVYRTYDTAINIQWLQPFEQWLNTKTNIFKNVNVSYLMFSCYYDDSSMYYIVSPIKELDYFILLYFIQGYMNL